MYIYIYIEIPMHLVFLLFLRLSGQRDVVGRWRDKSQLGHALVFQYLRLLDYYFLDIRSNLRLSYLKHCLIIKIICKLCKALSQEVLTLTQSYFVQHSAGKLLPWKFEPSTNISKNEWIKKLLWINLCCDWIFVEGWNFCCNGFRQTVMRYKFLALIF